jgi:hypothetical protein
LIDEKECPMTRFKSITAACALACTLLPTAGRAADDVATVRAELQALKKDYDARVAALEARIAQLESSAAAPVASTAPVPAPQPVPAPNRAGNSGAAAFNPALSLILVGSYASLSQDPANYRIAGFIPNGGEGPGRRGFSLGESELTVAANVDPYFFANATISVLADNHIQAEEAYFKTTALPDGFVLKGGRFFSGIGYLNEVHAHAWDFIDQPLIYQALFASQFAQDGVQLKWVAPTDTFIELGAEAGNGANFPGTDLNSNRLNAYVLFAHVGGDISDSTSWRTGASWLDESANDRVFDDGIEAGKPVQNAFTGKSRTWMADAILKWAPHGDPTIHQLKVQAEYMHREEDGQLFFDGPGASLGGLYNSVQSGWYLQSVYQFMPRWRVGARYDDLDSGTARIGLVANGLFSSATFPVLLPATPRRVTAMLDWSPSEFSRLRAQYAWDEARAADERDRQFFLQYIYAIGAHGAHKF